MSTETSERQAHLRAITITSLTALVGVGAAVGSAMLTTGPDAAVTADLPKLLVLAAIAVQLPLYQFVYDEWGGAKDFLYVGFMTFCFWFMTFGIILETGVFY
jgi:hypothetical protein